jgi:carboxylesterase type B
MNHTDVTDSAVVDTAYGKVRGYVFRGISIYRGLPTGSDSSGTVTWRTWAAATSQARRTRAFSMSSQRSHGYAITSIASEAIPAT